jgi:hypothetical protein
MVKTKVLERLQMSTAYALPPGIERGKVRTQWADYDQRLVASLSAYVLSDKVVDEKQTVTFTYPASAWEYIKRDYMPKWVRDRWPVKLRKKMVEVRFEGRHNFPHADPAWQRQLGDAIILQQVTHKPAYYDVDYNATYEEGEGHD